MAGLEVRGLKVVFETDDGIVEAVRGIDFDVQPGERLGLVGESGSGKTTRKPSRRSPAEHAASAARRHRLHPAGAMNSVTRSCGSARRSPTA